MSKTEQRDLIREIEVRESEDSMKMTGYAVKWGLASHKIGGRFTERFLQGAFSETLQKDDQRFFYAHDPTKVLGRTKNGTLRLEEDAIGLRFEVDLPKTTLGKDTFESVKRGDVDGVSFGFRASEEDWDRRDKTNIIRTVKKASLLEVSAVTFPAYPDSEVSTRGHDPFAEYNKQDEQRKRLILQTFI